MYLKQTYSQNITYQNTVQQRKIMTKVGCNRSCGYWALGQKSSEKKEKETKKKCDKNSMLAENPANIKRNAWNTVYYY